MTLIPHIKHNDWKSVEQAIAKLASLKLGRSGTPTFAGLTLTDLTASRLIASDASKNLSSVSSLTSWIAGTANEINIADDGDGTITIGIVDPLIVGKGGTGVATLTDHGILLGSGTSVVTPLGVAGNGKIPIGSAGADPVLAEIAGTANQITSTPGAGTITLSTPQDIHTGASPTFVALTLTASAGNILWNTTDLANRLSGTRYKSTGAGPIIQLSHARGDIGAEEYLDGGNTIGAILFRAWDESGTPQFENVAQIRASAELNHVANNLTSKLVFATTAVSTMTDRMSINADGDVRVFNGLSVGSDTNPTHTLDVYGTGIFIDDGAGRTLIIENTGNLPVGAKITAGAGDALSLGSNATIGAIVIDNTGQVGIGTFPTEPTHTLTVEGDFKVNASALVVKATTDEVGVGISTPISTLHVYEDTSTSGVETGITIENDGTGDAILQFLLTGSRRWVMGIDNSSVGDKFKIADQVNLRTDWLFVIDNATNNVGIGKNLATPAAKLHIDQETDNAAMPVLLLDQADVSEEMIEFTSTIGVGNAIEAVGGKTLTATHFIKVTLPGDLTRYIPVGTIA